jgi:hypothetical protein
MRGVGASSVGAQQRRQVTVTAGKAANKMSRRAVLFGLPMVAGLLGARDSRAVRARLERWPALRRNAALPARRLRRGPPCRRRDDDAHADAIGQSTYLSGAHPHFWLTRFSPFWLTQDQLDVNGGACNAAGCYRSLPAWGSLGAAQVSKRDGPF